MSEYVTIRNEATADPDVMELYINQLLTHTTEEYYSTPEQGEDGSTLAQTLFNAVDGIRALTIRPDCLIVTREADVPWEYIIDDIRDALRDFFL